MSKNYNAIPTHRWDGPAFGRPFLHRLAGNGQTCARLVIARPPYITVPCSQASDVCRSRPREDASAAAQEDSEQAKKRARLEKLRAWKEQQAGGTAPVAAPVPAAHLQPAAAAGAPAASTGERAWFALRPLPPPGPPREICICTPYAPDSVNGSCPAAMQLDGSF